MDKDLWTRDSGRATAPPRRSLQRSLVAVAAATLVALLAPLVPAAPAGAAVSPTLRALQGYVVFDDIYMGHLGDPAPDDR